MSSRPEGDPPVSVVVGVLGSDPAAVSRTLDAVRRQVYEPVRLVIAGSGDGLGSVADQIGASLVANASEVVKGLQDHESHVWLLLQGAVPRPDALRALVEETERVDASVAGSKLLRAEQPDQLLSVGVATDVFDDPFLGLDSDEVDAGQYDVLRDVAAVTGASVLVRRDLARGLGGPDPDLRGTAAAIDLCQRARLRGARVVVVPSSEVLYPSAELERHDWKEEAGRIRAMVKAYSLLTLAWALPLRFLIGLLEAVVAPLLGRWTAFRFMRAWLWNLLFVPATLAARSAARMGRVGDDSELFRFQIRGSARLRDIVEDAGGRLRSRFGTAEELDLVALGRDLRQPGLLAGLAMGAFLVLATRSLWSDGFPLGGFSFPLPETGWDAAAAYAGGWNPGGLGSAESLPPFIGLAGIVQAVLFDSPQLAAAVLVLGSALLGTFGLRLLLKDWGVDLVPSLAAAVVLVAGPATRHLAGDGAVAALVGVGLLPWAVRIAAAPWPVGRRRIFGRISGVLFSYALLAAVSPLLVVSAAALLALAGIAGLVRERRVVWVGSMGVAAGALAVLPWLTAVDLPVYLGAGDAFWETHVVLLVAFGVAAIAALLVAPGALGAVGIWGTLAAAAGGWIARSHAAGAGREVESAALAAAAVGAAAVVAAVFETTRRVEVVKSWDRLVAGVGAVGALAVLLSGLLVIVPGRAGLPGGELADAFRFISAAGDEEGVGRVLLVGPADELPGESRSLRGAAYRVLSAPDPTLAEAWLPAPGDADVALSSALEAAVAGQSFRVGGQLTGFGIKWVIVTGDTPFEAVMRSQLDLIPLDGLRLPTFLVESEDPVARAVASDGSIWRRTPWGFEGPAAPGERVRISEAAHPGWGPPPWTEAEWANEVSAEDGVASFSPDGARRLEAQLSLAGILVLLVLAWWGRRAR